MSKHKGQFHFDGYVVRWNSNNSVPPVECLIEMVNDKEITAYQLQESCYTHVVETQAFLDNYRKQMENHVPDSEELYEMRSAFGEGEVVVDVISGRRIQL